MATLFPSSPLSDAMGAKLLHHVAPNLDLDTDASPKGLLVVGNYGTGKSHLMSVIGAIAEHDDLHLEHSDNPEVDAALDAARGRYVVVRLTIGAVFKGLRDILLDHLQAELAKDGIAFDVPPLTAVNENTSILSQMMQAFQAKHQGKGLLLIVDELLDYLRQQNSQSQFAAFGFLREVGEFCAQSNFRFIAGLQASLFGDTGFAADPELANHLARVKDRFHTLEIEKTDVRVVVSRRMLAKTPEQKAWIREHLQQFIAVFENLEREMDTFVDLWPVHPRFLEVFHRMHISEKRQVFNEVSEFIRTHQDEDVPDAYPGLLTYDLHWLTLQTRKELEANADVRAVKEAMQTIESRIDQAMESWQKEPALTLVRALAVHRFTTPNLKVKVGLTADDLRLEVFPWLPKLPKKDPAMMREMIVALLKGVQDACRGQLLDAKDDQWFIDLDLTQNWDHLVQENRTRLSKSDKDRYFFDVLKQVVLGNITRESDVPNHFIYAHELPWHARGVTRPGWLFFGAPNERPTAKPPKDYYLYVLPPWDPPNFTDEEKEEELFLLFKGRSESNFKPALETYASAKQLAKTHAHGRGALQAIAQEQLKRLVAWMDQHFSSLCDLRWKGEAKPLEEWTDAAKSGTVDQRIHAAASFLLNPHFASAYQRHPKFEVAAPITEESRGVLAASAISSISQGSLSNTTRPILAALELLNGNDIEVSRSSYVQRIEAILDTKSDGEVTNFEELLEFRHERHFSRPDQLDPEWLIVLLAGLVHKGSVVITYPAIGQITIDRLGEVANRKGDKLWNFTHVSRPRGLDIAAMKAICKLLGIPPARVSEDERELKALTLTIREKAEAKVKQLLDLMGWLETEPHLWGTAVVEGPLEKRDELGRLKAFLDSLDAYDKPAKWANLKPSAADIEAYQAARTLEADIVERQKARSKVDKAVNLLERCKEAMPPTNGWRQSLQPVRDRLDELWSSATPFEASRVPPVLQLVNGSLADYRREYTELHKAHRLDHGLEQRKKALVEDERLDQLRRLSQLDLFNKASFDQIQDELASLQSCWQLEDRNLEQQATCPHCHFRPSTPDPPNPISGADLDRIDQRLDDMLQEWTRTFATELAGLRAPLDAFEAELQMPDDPAALGQLVASAKEAFSKLVRREVTTSALLGSVMRTGEALSPDEFEDRVRTLITELCKGLDRNKVRIVLNDDTKPNRPSTTPGEDGEV
jgi:hypothetical protein